MWGNPFTVRNIPSARCFHPHPWKFLKKSVPSFLCCWQPQLGLLFLSAGSLAGFLKLIQIPGRAFALPTERVRKPPNDQLVKCENLARAASVCSCLDTSQVCAYLSPREGLRHRKREADSPSSSSRSATNFKNKWPWAVNMLSGPWVPPLSEGASHELPWVPPFSPNVPWSHDGPLMECAHLHSFLIPLPSFPSHRYCLVPTS